jgi:hypothetical protein
MNSDNRDNYRIASPPTCRCQRCPTCIDNARWERIFREKFADPNYYARPVARQTSPMVDL